MPNTLVFVDFPSPDPAATARFYAELFGWHVEGRPEGDFHRFVPGEGWLHMGTYNSRTQTPDPTKPKEAPSRQGLQPRTYIKVESDPAEYIAKAEGLGATVLWGETWWPEFGGWHASFLDPWGNQICLWYKGKPGPNGEE
jgi:predicted enzyme related to lactoylglutathione lyase